MFEFLKSKQERIQLKAKRFLDLQKSLNTVNENIDQLAIDFKQNNDNFTKALETEQDEFIKSRIEEKYSNFKSSHLKEIGRVKKEKEAILKSMSKNFDEDEEFQTVLKEEKLHKAHSTIINKYRNNEIDLNTCDTLLKGIHHKYISKSPDGKGGWNYTYGEPKKVIKKKKEENNDFKKVKDYANKVINGERQIERLSPEAEQGRIRGGKANVEATILIGANAEASDRSKEPYERDLIQKELVESYAKENKLWIERLPEFNSNNFIDSGAEAKVYKYGSNNVVKINNLSQHEELIEFLDRVAAHNYLFPDTKYEVLGFGKFDGDFSIIVKQPFIEGKGGVSKDVVSREMSKMGFESEGGNNYRNDFYLIEDLHKGNVLNTKYGLMFIDPIIYINKPEEGYGGKYKVGDIDITKSTDIDLFKAVSKTLYADNIVYNDEGKILLLRRSENDKTFPGMWVIPGGHIDLGEEPETAAKRELYEEAGIEAEKPEQVGEYEDNKVHIRYFESHVGDKEPVLQQEEQWGYEWVSVDDLQDYPMPMNMCENILKIVRPFKLQVIKIKLYSNVDIESPKSKEEKELDKKLSDLASKMNQIVSLKRKKLKELGKSQEQDLIKAWESAQIGEIRTHKDGKKYRKVAQTGDKNKDWQLVAKDKSGNKEPESKSTKSDKQGDTGQKQSSPEELSTAARNASENALNAAIKGSGDEAMRQAAHEELDRRSKEEAIQEEPEGGESEEKKIKVYRGKGKNIGEGENKGLNWVATDKNVAENYGDVSEESIDKPKNVFKLPFRKNPDTNREVDIKGSDISNLLYLELGDKFESGEISEEKIDSISSKIDEYEKLAGNKLEPFPDKINKPESVEKFAEILGDLGYDAVEILENNKDGKSTKTFGIINKSQKEEKKEESKKEVKNITIDSYNQSLKDKYKEAATQLINSIDYSGEDFKNLSNQQSNISIFLQESNKFNEKETKEAFKNINEYFGFKNDNQVKDLFGDGKIIGLSYEKLDDDTIKVNSLLEDGIIKRRFDVKSKQVFMDLFLLNPFYEKGKGKGTNVFNNQIKQFKKIGFESVYTIAAQGKNMNGYYTWARAGYDINVDNDKGKIDKMQFDMLMIEKNRKEKSLPELMSTEEGRKFWKENGFEFFGIYKIK